MKTVLLVLQLLAPGQEPKHFQTEMPSLEECLGHARGFLETFEKDTDVVANTKAIAGCVLVEPEKA